MFPITQRSLKPTVSVRGGIGSIQCLKMPQSINKINHHYPHIDCLNIFGCLIVVSNPGLVSDVICFNGLNCIVGILGEHLIVVYMDEHRGHWGEKAKSDRFEDSRCQKMGRSDYYVFLIEIIIIFSFIYTHTHTI